MTRFAYAGVAVAALIAVPVLAQPGRADGAPEPKTRAAVEAEVEARFARLDSDRDGFVTRDEARAAVEARREQRAERRSERRAALFDRLDSNGDGSISRAEFEAPRAAPGDRAAKRAERRAHRMAHRADRRMHRGAVMARFGARAFEEMDRDDDGRVSRAEASARAMALFDRVDTDRDGTVSVEERRSAREAFRAQRRERRGS